MLSRLTAFVPLVFHRVPNEGGQPCLKDLICDPPNSKAREAVVSYLSQMATRSEGCMSERLKKAVSDHSKKSTKSGLLTGIQQPNT